MVLQDSQKRLLEANKLLVEKTTSAGKLESLSVILKGLNPKLDIALQNCAENFSKIEKLQSGDVISLSATSLPENSEEEKRRKKAILAFIRTWEDLKSEVERIKIEFENSRNPTQQAQSAGKIITFAKGPFGIITILATIVVGTILLVNFSQSPKSSSSSQTQTTTPALLTASPLTPSPVPTASPQAKKKVQVIIVNDKKIPLIELVEITGVECDKASHYHALNHTSAKALDGSSVADPGGCGFGKVSEVDVVETE